MEDNKLDAFFAEVDKLSINDNALSSASTVSDKNNSHPIKSEKIKGDVDVDVDAPKRNNHNKHYHMIANANNSQKAWSDFKKLDLPSSNDDSAVKSSGEKKISFQIKNVKGKKKKKTKKKDDNTQVNKDTIAKIETISTPCDAGYHAVDDDMTLECPRWILVIDTCALIEDSGYGVQQLIRMAKNAAKSGNIRTNNYQSRQYTAAIVDDEHVSVVIPFKVWGELDYLHKSSEGDSKNAYAARTAIRMLRDELKTSTANNKSSVVIRSQSLLESNEAASKFLPADDIQSRTNDDHILACALIEHEKHCKGSNSSSGKSAVGGVVIITLDNNLTCKAYANELKVYAPSNFKEYYDKRMASLRERAAGRLAGSAQRI